VWLLASAALVGLGCSLLPDLTAAAGVARDQRVAFDQALVWASEAVLLTCAAWLWLVTGVVSIDAARGRTVARAGVPAGLRRLLLTACGAALLATVTVPAGAAPGTGAGDRSAPGVVVRGLPLPDRATAAGHVGLLLARQARAADHRPAPADPVAVVRPGDTLWSLARSDLPPGAEDTAVALRWRQIYRANRQVIGPDPDLIQPAQRLHLPRP